MRERKREREIFKGKRQREKRRWVKAVGGSVQRKEEGERKRKRKKKEKVLMN